MRLGVEILLLLLLLLLLGRILCLRLRLWLLTRIVISSSPSSFPGRRHLRTGHRLLGWREAGGRRMLGSLRRRVGG